MYRFIESIKILDGMVYNLDYHQKRVDKTFRKHYQDLTPLELKLIFKDILIPENGLYKLRLLYNDIQYKIEINEYKPRLINKLHIIEDNNIDYTYKYADRSIFDKYTSKLNKNEDIMIVKNGYITDSSYSNLIFCDGKKWITPSLPLLSGTKRQKLIDNNIIEIDDIKLSDINHFKSCKLINAMLDIEESMQIKL